MHSTSVLKFDLKLAADSVDEEFPAIFSGIKKTGSFDFIANASNDVLDFVIGEKVGDFTRGEHVIDQNQEILVGHLCVCHQKHDSHVLQSGLQVQSGQFGLCTLFKHYFYLARYINFSCIKGRNATCAASVLGRLHSHEFTVNVFTLL